MNEDKEVKVEEVSVEQQPADAPEAVEPKIDDLQNQISELNDKYLRAVAELENTRRRTARDIESVARNRAMSVANEFLPVIDAVFAALKLSPDDSGIKSMVSAMESAFARVGIVKIESIGQQLNPQFHNAIQVVDKPTPETQSNTIIDELQTGYMFGDVVLRPAMVIVCK